LLTGTARDALLEIGLAKQWEPTTGYYVIIRAPRGELQPQELRVAADQRLVDARGEAIQQYPYAIFSIDATADRPNWFEIPELKKAFDELNAEVQRGRIEEARQSFAVFRRSALTSPDLLFDDAKVIADKVDARVKETLAGIQTAGHEPTPLPELVQFSPFAESA
jgi:hypothetical protein